MVRKSATDRKSCLVRSGVSKLQRGPNLAREAISSGSKGYILSIMKKYYTYEKCVEWIACNATNLLKNNWLQAED